MGKKEDKTNLRHDVSMSKCERGCEDDRCERKIGEKG